ncbi:MAG TPA: hypothetical protein VFI41_12825 [Gemmatimonadales bacterium]|nr:hypothetical protein [Gemmatimonadales bacterium]
MKGRIRVKYDGLTHTWAAFVNGRRIVSGWPSAGMARAKCREYLGWRGQGGAFGGGYVKLNKERTA